MKQCKTLLSIVMAIMMLLTMMIPTLAVSGTNDNTGKITIDNAVAGQEYSVYQLLVLESFDTEKPAYSYKVATKWENFFKKGVSIDGESVDILDTYVSIDAKGYVTWIKKDASGNYIDADKFAKYAAAYAEENSIVAEATKTAEADKTLEFSGLNLGYYLVDTSLGTLCSLDTTAKEVNIQEKNAVPTIEKQVKEGEAWDDESSAQIGDTVEFKTTVHAKKGAKNYVVHDQMEDGLTLNPSSFKVTVNGTEVTAAGNCTITTSGLTDDCDFEIAFTQAYLDTITADTDIVITYSAVLNEEAEIATDSNDNKTKLDFSDKVNTSTEWDTTKTYTYKFDLVKTDSNNKVLNGAEFELYDAKTGGNKIDLVKESEGVYRIATAEDKVEGFTSAVIEAGNVTIKGLDANTTYWLEETKAPAGYNKLSERVEVKIVESNLTATFEEEATDTWKEGGVHVINQSGTELPSTGGIGTTIFYCVGATLALGAFVLLVTKKRMGRE